MPGFGLECPAWRPDPNMLPRVPRWFFLVLLLAAGAFLVWQVKPVTLELPPTCLAAEDAMEAQDFDEAIENYFLCLEARTLPDPVQAHIFYNLGNAYSAKGNHHQAIEDYSEALLIDPSHGWAYNNRCWSRGLLRQATEALQDCQEALRLLPDRPEILDSRAFAYWQLGEHNLAVADLARAQEIDGSLPSPDERFSQFEAMLQ